MISPPLTLCTPGFLDRLAELSGFVDFMGSENPVCPVKSCNHAKVIGKLETR